jgi:putative PIN family toxin of toxin-antitoxin system
VLDTNLVLSALVFGGAAAGLRKAWQRGACVPLLSTATAHELIRVLAYPKFRLSGDEQEQLLADYLPYAASIRITDPPPRVPECRDPFDLLFLHLGMAGKADALVTGDSDLLALAGRLPFPVLTLAEFLARLRQ